MFFFHTNTLRSIQENATPKTVPIFSKYFSEKPSIVISLSNIFPSKWLSVTQIIDDSEAMSSKYDNLFSTPRAFKWKTENLYSWGPGFWWISLSRINNSKRIQVDWIFVEKGKWQVCVNTRMKFCKKKHYLHKIL